MSSNSRPPITVSIVSHGQQDLIIPLLQQLNRHCEPWIDKLLLTINIDEPDLVTGTDWGLRLEVIRNSQAKGFGANHNAAFTRCESEWLLVLNPDIRLENDVLRELLRGAPTHSGMTAPRIMEPGKLSPEPYRDLLTPCEIVQRRRPGYRPPPQPAWIPGMFMLFRAQAFRQIGGFDPRYFMYGEDFDVCARLRLHGWRIHIAEHLSVRHDARRASRREWHHLRWHCVSLLKVWLSPAFWRYRTLWLAEI